MRSKIVFLAFLMSFSFIFSSCTSANKRLDENTIDNFQNRYSGTIFLYGETHGSEKIIDEEFEIWNNYYHSQNMRHLFIEMPFYTAEFLNLWMISDNETIINDIYKDWKGTLAQNPYNLNFYKKIKEYCPETIFHGTDVGHQYETTGQRYLKYLEKNNLVNSINYDLTLNTILQGKTYYQDNQRDVIYRENIMVENFIRELDNLNNEDIMGIYGAAHTDINSLDNTNSVPCMANQLSSNYNLKINSINLSGLAKDIDPIREETIFIGDKKYRASYFGKEDLQGFKDFMYREFWRIEDAYDDFKRMPKTGDVLPYDNYPMLIDMHQVFVVDIAKNDDSINRFYYRSDGNSWNKRLTTEGFELKF